MASHVPYPENHHVDHQGLTGWFSNHVNRIFLLSGPPANGDDAKEVEESKVKIHSKTKSWRGEHERMVAKRNLRALGGPSGPLKGIKKVAWIGTGSLYYAKDRERIAKEAPEKNNTYDLDVICDHFALFGILVEEISYANGGGKVDGLAQDPNLTQKVDFPVFASFGAQPMVKGIREMIDDKTLVWSPNFAGEVEAFEDVFTGYQQKRVPIYIDPPSGGTSVQAVGLNAEELKKYHGEGEKVHEDFKRFLEQNYKRHELIEEDYSKDLNAKAVVATDPPDFSKSDIRPAHNWFRRNHGADMMIRNDLSGADQGVAPEKGKG